MDYKFGKLAVKALHPDDFAEKPTTLNSIVRETLYQTIRIKSPRSFRQIDKTWKEHYEALINNNGTCTDRKISQGPRNTIFRHNKHQD